MRGRRKTASLRLTQLRFGCAERQRGELIKAQKETVGLAHGRRTDLVPNGNQVDKPTLAEAGKSFPLVPKLAAVPEHKFEGMVGEWRTQPVKITQ
jgi:hypothetical protein